MLSEATGFAYSLKTRMLSNPLGTPNRRKRSGDSSVLIILESKSIPQLKLHHQIKTDSDRLNICMDNVPKCSTLPILEG